MFVFFGCGNAPRVRLVKDNDTTFHFQWAEPLKEERIILIRGSGGIVDEIGGGEPPVKRRYPWEIESLVYFPAGSFISAPASSSRIWLDPDLGNTWKYTYSVEILPAHLRNTVAVPARLFTIRDGDFKPHGERVILREHPFQEYHVGAPSRLTFERLSFE